RARRARDRRDRAHGLVQRPRRHGPDGRLPACLRDRRRLRDRGCARGSVRAARTARAVPGPGAGRSGRLTMPFTSPLAEALADDVLERFLRYVRVDTQSARDRTGSPSTPGQLDLSRMLVEELRAIGLEDVSLDENGYVMATLPSTTRRGEPVIGLIAHVDTSPDAPSAGVEPIV